MNDILSFIIRPEILISIIFIIAVFFYFRAFFIPTRKKDINLDEMNKESVKKHKK